MADYSQFVSDDTTPTDSITKGPYVPLVDAPVILDLMVRGTSRALGDSASFSDSLIRTAGKFFSGALTLADSLGGHGVGKALADLPLIVDAFSRHWTASRLWTDRAAVGEAISKNPAKAAFVEVPIVISDKFAKVANKVVSEILPFAESLFWPSSPRIMQAIDTSVRILSTIVGGN